MGVQLCSLVYEQWEQELSLTLWLALGNYSSYCFVLLSLNVRQGAQSYLTLICHALLIPTGRLSLSEQKIEDWMGGKGRGE